METIIARAMGAAQEVTPRFEWTFDEDEIFKEGLMLIAKSMRVLPFGPGTSPGMTPVTVKVPEKTKIACVGVRGVALAFGDFSTPTSGELGGFLFQVEYTPVVKGEFNLDVWALLKSAGVPVSWVGKLAVEVLCYGIHG